MRLGFIRCFAAFLLIAPCARAQLSRDELQQMIDKFELHPGSATPEIQAIETALNAHDFSTAIQLSTE